jgi:hypothetical protein
MIDFQPISGGNDELSNRTMPAPTGIGVARRRDFDGVVVICCLLLARTEIIGAFLIGREFRVFF